MTAPPNLETQQAERVDQTNQICSLGTCPMAHEAVRGWTSKTCSPGGAVRDWTTIGFPGTCHWVLTKCCLMLAATCQIRSWPSALLILRISLEGRRAIAFRSLLMILQSRASLDRRGAKVKQPSTHPQFDRQGSSGSETPVAEILLDRRS